MALFNVLHLAMAEEHDRRTIKRKIDWPERFEAFNYPENVFIAFFRLTKSLCAELIERLRPALEPRTCRKNAFSVETKVFCALRFYATGSYQKNIATDITASMSQGSISNAIRNVTEAINELMFEDYINFPVHENEREMLKREFYDYSGFPGVIGAIDCTHVAIVAPHDDDEHFEKNYVNRKNFHSINVQLVCDMQMRIISISARFPGCTHDSYIWRMSLLRDWFLSNSSNLKNTWLLGDSGYPLEPWLMTPHAGTSPAEESYNVKHKLGRNVIERCNGVLKGRFRCLLKYRTLHYAPTVAARIINACAVLHNLCIREAIDVTNVTLDDENLPFDTGLPSTSNRNGEATRRRLINMLH